MNTPNLSREYHPVPKPNRKIKDESKKLGLGKKIKEWDKERKILIEEFDKLGITSCELRLEGCTKDNYLGFAHLDKRRNLTKEDLPKVVLACSNCHDSVEYLNRIRMRQILEAIIKARK